MMRNTLHRESKNGGAIEPLQAAHSIHECSTTCVKTRTLDEFMRRSLFVIVILFSAAFVVSISLRGMAVPRVTFTTAHASADTEETLPLPFMSIIGSGVSLFDDAEAQVLTEAAPEPPAMQMRKARGADARPVRLVIPSVQIDTRVINVGVNRKGEMDVPDGNTNDVGWLKQGTLPGDVGSAVLDAHVYAAFEDLRYVKVGEDIYVYNAAGEKLHFIVEASTVYKLSELEPKYLFDRKDARRLNLITCAGTFQPSWDTYTHRLVVYAIFAGVVAE